jgi:hypothetical protein
MTKSIKSLSTIKDLGTPKALSLTKKEWDGYLASLLNFFINTPSFNNRSLLFEAMKQYKDVHKTSSFKLSNTGKS